MSFHIKSKGLVILWFISLYGITYCGTLSTWLPLLESSYKMASSPNGTLCLTSPYLTTNQRELCQKSPTSLVYVVLSLRLALKQCQQTFHGDRWNCSTESFKAFSSKGTKESAYIYSITSAALTHSVVRACTAGNMTTCSCGKMNSKRKRNAGVDLDAWPSNWQWGGCSDNIKYGQSFSKRFTDSHLRKIPKENSIRKDDDQQDRVTLHNNKVGRKLVSQKMKTDCRCHGASGTCAISTCWRYMARFDIVGEELKKLYDKSSVLISNTKQRGRRKKKLQLADSHSKRSVKGHSLVYTETSPDFCQSHPHLGISGVKGRECNKTSTNTQSCRSLCCGAGYDTKIVTIEERCNCKFQWCCFVTCDTCIYKKEVYTCK